VYTNFDPIYILGIYTTPRERLLGMFHRTRTRQRTRFLCPFRSPSFLLSISAWLHHWHVCISLYLYLIQPLSICAHHTVGRDMWEKKTSLMSYFCVLITWNCVKGHWPDTQQHPKTTFEKQFLTDQWYKKNNWDVNRVNKINKNTLTILLDKTFVVWFTLGHIFSVVPI